MNKQLIAFVVIICLVACIIFKNLNIQEDGIGYGYKTCYDNEPLLIPRE